MIQAQTDALYISLVPEFDIEFGVGVLGSPGKSRILDGVLSLYFKSNEALFSLNGGFEVWLQFSWAAERQAPRVKTLKRK